MAPVQYPLLTCGDNQANHPSPFEPLNHLVQANEETGWPWLLGRGRPFNVDAECMA